MKTYRLPIKCEMFAVVDIEAESLKEAYAKVYTDVPPFTMKDVDDSFEIDDDFVKDYNKDVTEQELDEAFEEWMKVLWKEAEASPDNW